MAVFVPVAFIPGMTGLINKQFALTIAMAVGLSGFNSLTLSPALCAVLLRPGSGKSNVFFRAFNKGFDKLSSGYAASVKVMAKMWYVVLAVFIGPVPADSLLVWLNNHGICARGGSGLFSAHWCSCPTPPPSSAPRP